MAEQEDKHELMKNIREKWETWKGRAGGNENSGRQ